MEKISNEQSQKYVPYFRTPLSPNPAFYTIKVDSDGWETVEYFTRRLRQSSQGGKGDQFVYVLQVDSSTASGLKWDSLAAGGMTLINTGGTTLSGASTTISSIPSTYINLFIIVQNFQPSADDGFLLLRYNSDSNSRYYSAASVTSSNLGFTDTAMYLNGGYDNGASSSLIATTIYNYANTSTWKLCQTDSIGNHPTTTTNLKYQKYFGAYNQTGAISSLTFAADSGTNTSGTVYVYGVK